MITLRFWQKSLLVFPALLLATTLFGQTAGQNQSPAKVAANESVEVHLGKGYEALQIRQEPRRCRFFPLARSKWLNSCVFSAVAPPINRLHTKIGCDGCEK
jgi:hypothetical protein